MSAFSNSESTNGLHVKLWRGERMCLVGIDVDEPEGDFVGFAIEVQSPGSPEFRPLRNRLNFSYDRPTSEAVNGNRQYPSTEAPFQRFRWIHFPYEPLGGRYAYRVTKMHMPRNGPLVPGTSQTLDIALDPTTYDDFLDVGFTRNFASSQAYAETFKNNDRIIPADANQGLEFQKVPGRVYQWLGFEAYDLIFQMLDEAVQDRSLTLDVLAYDLNEPDIIERLERLGNRLRIAIDDSGDHAAATSAETKAAVRLARSAGSERVRRMHFEHLQHNKVFIAKRDGKPFKTLHGSTNFSFRGIYIQANNVLVFRAAGVPQLFARMFDLAFDDPASFGADPISAQWHLVNDAGKPPVHFCFSPHRSASLSLNPVGGAIDQATSSVLYSIAFLSQIRSGPLRQAIDRLMHKTVFSYGIVNSTGNLEVRKPDSSIGLVDFSFLAEKAPEPFKSEWSGGKGINIHHKFVVTDFSLPTAKLFTGSSNLSPSGETGNGDNLVMIEDRRVATAYAIEALRMFDHLHFRSRMQEALARKAGTRSGASRLASHSLTLRKPTAISGEPAWFADYYTMNTQRERDRHLFSI